MEIFLATADLASIETHARADYPRECCGLLIAAKAAPRRITQIVATANRAEDPLTGFEIDPQRHIDAHRALRGSSEAIVGCYHSHPTGRAEPSRTDRLAAHEPGFIWLIIALDRAGRLTHRAWLADGAGGFEALTILEESNARH